MKQWMKRSGLPSSVLLVTGLLFCGQCALGLVGRGAVHVARHVEARKVKRGETVKCAIRMQNLTPVPIDVFSEASCSCSVVDHSAGTIGPFGTYTTEIEIDTARSTIGEHHKAVTVKFRYADRTWIEPIDLKLHTW